MKNFTFIVRHKRCRKFSTLLLAASCLTWPGLTLAGGVAPPQEAHLVPVQDGKTNVYTAPNGVPVVDIATVNSTGLSHNRFQEYSVDSRGVVLNNGNTDKVARQSQLAGQVTANLNLTREADIILNEVVNPNRSIIAGYTEVLGKTADVVVANPYGITCNGCGFINTQNVTLTTGVPQISGGGALTGFNVQQGDILISGAGLDGTTPNYLALVARKVKFDAQTNANVFDVVTGTNIWDYNLHTATPQAATGSAPDYAIDSTLLGGMYANRIRFIATEAGVGVRMLGDVAANGDDFTINSAGLVQLNSKVSAQRDLSIASTATGSAMNFSGASLTAQRDLSLTATTGVINLSGGVVKSGRDLSINAGGLTDVTSDDSITDNNKRYAARALAISVTATGSVDGTSYGAATSWLGTFGNFTGLDAAKFYAGTSLGITGTTGDLIFNAMFVQAQSDLTVLAQQGAITTQSGASQGLQSVSGNLSLSSHNGFTNAGTVTADAGSVTMRVGSLTNSGTIHAKTTMNFADFTAGATENINNSGTILTEDAATVLAATATNSGIWQNNNGTTLTATNVINSGSLIGSVATADSATLTVNTLTNTASGIIQSAKDLMLNATSTLSNSGKILATAQLMVRGTTGSTDVTITNASGGVIQAGTTLDVKGVGGGSHAKITDNSGTMLANQLLFSLSSANNSGTIQGVTGNTLSTTATLSNSSAGKILFTSATGSGTINVGTLNNSGLLQSANTLALNLASTFANSGTVISASDMTLRGESSSNYNISNSGWLQANTLLDIEGYNAGTAATLTANSGTILTNHALFNLNSLTNSGLIQSSATNNSISTVNTLTNNAAGNILFASSTGSGTINAATISNTGKLQSANTLALNLTSALSNTGTLISVGNLTVRGQTSSNYNVSNSGLIQTNATLSLKGNSAGSAATISSNSGIILGNLLDFNLNNLTNSGTIQGTAGANTLSVANMLTNNSSANILFVSATGSGTVNAASIDNQGKLQSGGALAVNVGSSLSNNGYLLATGNMTVRGETGSTYNISNGGWVQANGTLDIKGNGGGNSVTLGTQNGTILGGIFDLNLQALTNNGTVQANSGTINLAGAFVNNGSKSLIFASSTGTGTINATSITNNGNLQSLGNLALNTATLLSNSATIITSGNLTIRGSQDSIYSVTDSGLLQANGLLDIKGYNSGNKVNITTTSPTSQLIGNTVDFNATDLTFSDASGLTSTSNMTINAATLTFGGTSSYIVAASGGSGLGSLTFSGAVSNNAAIASSYDLSLTANGLTNTDTGGISAVHDLTINTGIQNLTNSGALYAGHDLTVPATVVFTNSATTGTVDSGNNINITSNSFINNNTVNATNNITITTNIFRNEITGGVPTRITPAIPYGLQVSHSDDPGLLWGAIGTSYRYYTETYYYKQIFASTPSTNRAQLIAGATMTVNFTDGYNTSSVMSAHTMNLNGTGTFTNDDLSLTQTNYTATWTESQTCYLLFCDSANHYGDTLSHTSSTYSPVSPNSGIFSNTLNASGFALVNLGSPYTTLLNNTSPYSASVGSTSKSGGSGSSVGGTTSGTTTDGGVSGSSVGSGASASNLSGGVNPVNPRGTVGFGGLTITLPTNPNGFFVTAQDPNAHYLIESNPRFKVGSNFVGSDYMAQRLGYNPDQTQKRLGDANYEAYLVQQQLISQTGRNLINLADSQADQLKRLMDDGVSEAKKLGLAYGAAPTPQQLANLDQDMVWMVSTVVNGQNVLAPVVYLSQATKVAIAGQGTGAQIVTNNANMNLKSLTNTGGTITATNTMNLTTQGDITNTSGTIQGGNLNLTSISGSINNNTLAETSGGEGNQQTTIGKTAGINATGNLNVNAAKDINNIGANMNAGGDASITAGNNINFDTIQDKESSTTHTSNGYSNPFQSSGSSTTTSTTTQVKSGLNVGGNLKAKAGNDLTLAGTDTNVGGNADINAGNNINIIDRANSSDTKTSSHESGIGVDGGLFGANTDDKEHYVQNSVGSKLNVGGNLTTTSGNTTTVKGSDVNATGDVTMNAKDVKVLAGENIDNTTEKSTSFKIGIDVNNTNSASAGAGASANADGGGASAKGYGAGGVADGGDASAGAQAQAGAKASSSTEISFAKGTASSTTDNNLTHTASSIKSGGKMNINATDKLQTVGSNLESGGDMTLNAKDMSFEAAQDVHTKTNKSSTTSVGMYVDGNADAEASANANAQAGDNSASAGASAGAHATGGAGLYAGNKSSDTSDGSTTAQTSSIKSGGNLTRKATNNITDVGTQIDVGGDLNQSAKTIDSKAAANTTWSNGTNSDDTAKIGGYASAHADASASGSGGMGSASAQAGASAGAEAGLEVQYNHNDKTTTENTSNAVVSNIKVKGNVTSTSTDKTSLEGTNITAGKDTTINAGSLDYTAAKNTSSKTSDGKNVSVDAKAGVGAGAGASTDDGASAGYGPQGSLDVKYGGKQSSSTSSQDQVGSLSTGGNLKINTTGDTHLVGTNIDAGGDASIKAGGNLTFDAAHDTKTSTKDSQNASASLSASESGDKKSVAGSVGGGMTNGKSSSDTETAGSIKSGGKLNLSAGKDATLVGTNVNGGGDTTIEAGGNVNLNAAKSTQSSNSDGFQASLSAGKDSEGAGDKASTTRSVGGKLSGNYGKDDSTTSQGGTVSSGGSLTIKAKGGDVNLEGTDVSAKDKASISATKDVNFKAATDTSTSSSIDGSLSLDNSNTAGGKDHGVNKKGVGGSLDGGYNTTSDQKAGSIKAGSVDVTAGNNATFVGTKIDSQGDTNVNAKGDVKFDAAKSSSFDVEGGISGKTKTTSGGTDDKGNANKDKTKDTVTLKKTGIGGSSDAEGAEINSGGNININSGGKTSFEGTQVDADGKANINAKGGVEERSAIGGGGAIGTDKIGAGMSVEDTKIKSGGQ